MFKSCIKVAWRNLVRTAGYSILNILGLGIGMSVALLIGLWVYHQFSYDRVLPDTERLYRVKVLGATVSQLWLMLSRDFIGLVILSCVIASPVAFYFLQNWLQKYDYRITIGPSIFFIAGGIALIIAIITASFQSIKAALANPVKSIRTE